MEFSEGSWLCGTLPLTDIIAGRRVSAFPRRPAAAAAVAQCRLAPGDVLLDATGPRHNSNTPSTQNTKTSSRSMSNTETMTPFSEYSTTSSGYLSCLVCALLLVSRTRETLGLAHPDERGPGVSVEGGSSGRRDRAYGHSSKIDTRNNSPELNHFLEDVLNAQDELKWIDRAVHRTNPRNVDSSSRRRPKSNEISRREFHAPRRVYLEDEIKAKREADENSSSSLASLKRTILELRDSLNPRESAKASNDPTTLESRRKLLWSHEAKSALGVAIAYYDYEDGAEAGSEILDQPAERQEKRMESPNGPPYVPVKAQIPKKDENAEEERKGERERQKLKNKYPKEEFIADTLDRDEESGDEKKKLEATSSPDGSNSRYASMVLKRIPSAPESEDSDYYSQCRNVESSRENASALSEKDVTIDEKNSFDDQRKINDEEPDVSVERTYLVISPSIAKRERKRSADALAKPRKRIADTAAAARKIVADKSPSSMTSDKSARNYFALKITDDMFKGGLEQSNPLGEDKPIVEGIESSPLSSSKSSSGSSSSSNRNSIVSLRSHKTTSPEWKVIEINDEKMPEPEDSRPPIRGIGRRLTELVTEGPTSRANVSSTFLVPAANNQLSKTTLIPTDPNAVDNDTTRIREHEIKGEIIPVINTTEIFGRTNFSKSSIPTTRHELHGVTLVFGNSSGINEKYNNTRIRRHAGPFARGDRSRRPRHKVHHEHAQESDENHKKLSVDTAESDANHRKLTVLLAADNIEDESQIDLAVHGELAGKIVERIFEEVQRNEGLKVAFGPGLYRKHKPQESMALDKMYRQGLDEDEVKETEAMMRRVMELLGRLVLDEVRRKTCASLAPDMRDFLQWTLGLEELAEPLSDQVPPLPMIPNGLRDTTEKPSPSADKFLFQGSPDRESLQSNDLPELERKVSLLKSLINEYHALTEREKTKVQTVHDYLERQLALLMKYIESKEAANHRSVAPKSEVAGARLPAVGQQILQYQASAPERAKNPRNIFNGSNAEATSSNYSAIGAEPPAYSYRNNGFHDQRSLWIGRKGRKHDSLESRRVRHQRVKKRSTSDASIESLEYRKLLRRIATLRRRKRENSLGYEKPRIYIAPLEPQLPSQLGVSLSRRADPEQPRQPPAATTSAAPLSHSDPPINSSTPVRGKNRLEDEVLLLNKREAWRKENERLLEEVAFGKDTRNDLISGDENAERLSNRDQEQRMKRALDIDAVSASATSSTSAPITSDDKNDLRSIESKLNAFPAEVKSARTIGENFVTATANLRRA